MQSLILIAVLCIAAPVFSQEGNLVQLAEKLGAKTLVSLVTDAGLADTLANGGPFTVFGPTDAAFAKLPKFIVQKLKEDKKLLQEVLKYHLISGKVFSSQLKNELTAPSVAGPDIRINIYQGGKVVTASGSPIVMVDQNATNGVIHVVDRVLFPIPFEDIVKVVTTDPEFGTLKVAVVAAGLATALSGGPFTLFAPTNEAFRKLPAGALDNLLKNKTALTNVLEYHVVKGTQYSAGLTNGMSVPALNGADLKINIGSNGVTINTARVLRADESVTNGVIHVIDAVLLPPTS